MEQWGLVNSVTFEQSKTPWGRIIYKVSNKLWCVQTQLLLFEPNTIIKPTKKLLRFKITDKKFSFENMTQLNKNLQN